MADTSQSPDRRSEQTGSQVLPDVSAGRNLNRGSLELERGQGTLQTPIPVSPWEEAGLDYLDDKAGRS